MNEEVLKWISGSVESKPEDIKNLGLDFSAKLNWFLAATVLAQYSRLPRLVKAQKDLEEKILSEDEMLNVLVDPDKWVDTYDFVSKEISKVVGFAQKFISQNKEMLSDDMDFVEEQLLKKFKKLPSDLALDYLKFFTIVEAKGRDFLTNIIRENT